MAIDYIALSLYGFAGVLIVYAIFKYFGFNRSMFVLRKKPYAYAHILKNLTEGFLEIKRLVIPIDEKAFRYKKGDYQIIMNLAQGIKNTTGLHNLLIDKKNKRHLYYLEGKTTPIVFVNSDEMDLIGKIRVQTSILGREITQTKLFQRIFTGHQEMLFLIIILIEAVIIMIMAMYISQISRPITITNATIANVTTTRPPVVVPQ